MRNILEYPITADEIVETLTRLAEQERRRIEGSCVIGDMTGLVLDEAIKRIRETEP